MVGDGHDLLLLWPLACVVSTAHTAHSTQSMKWHSTRCLWCGKVVGGGWPLFWCVWCAACANALCCTTCGCGMPIVCCALLALCAVPAPIVWCVCGLNNNNHTHQACSKHTVLWCAACTLHPQVCCPCVSSTTHPPCCLFVCCCWCGEVFVHHHTHHNRGCGVANGSTHVVGVVCGALGSVLCCATNTPVVLHIPHNKPPHTPTVVFVVPVLTIHTIHHCCWWWWWDNGRHGVCQQAKQEKRGCSTWCWLVVAKPCTGHPQTHQTSPTTQQVVHWCWCGHNQTMLARFVWHGNVVGVFDPSNKTCCGAMLWWLHPVHHHHIACTPTHMPPCCHACLTPLQGHLANVVHHSVWPLASTPHLVVDVVALQPHLPPSHHITPFHWCFVDVVVDWLVGWWWLLVWQAVLLHQHHLLVECVHTHSLGLCGTKHTVEHKW